MRVIIGSWCLQGNASSSTNPYGQPKTLFIYTLPNKGGRNETIRKKKFFWENNFFGCSMLKIPYGTRLPLIYIIDMYIND